MAAVQVRVDDMHHALAWLLLATVVATHTVYLLFDPRDAERVFYVARGLEGVMLALCLCYFTFRPTVRRVPTAVLFVACVLAAYEEAMTAVCGWPFVFDLERSFPLVEPMAGLCGAITGLPWGLAEVFALVFALALFCSIRYGHATRPAA